MKNSNNNYNEEKKICAEKLNWATAQTILQENLFLYCKAGLYCSLGSLEGLKLYCER